MDEKLIAPCGMNCGLCSAYLAHSRGIPKKRGAISHCVGCRSRKKRCAYLKGNCPHIASGRFWYECDRFPCVRLQRIDKRYRINYNVSLIANLRQIAAEGLHAFLVEQEAKYRCKNCGGPVCIHNGKCYDCETIESWRKSREHELEKK